MVGLADFLLHRKRSLLVVSVRRQVAVVQGTDPVMAGQNQARLKGLFEGIAGAVEGKTLGLLVVFEQLSTQLKSHFKKLDQACTFHYRRLRDSDGRFEQYKRLFKMGQTVFPADVVVGHGGILRSNYWRKLF